MKNESGLQLPEEMLKFLCEHEPYDGRVPSDKFMSLLLNRYEQFTKDAAKLQEVTVFESSFLQNVVNELMGFQNLNKSIIIEYLCSLAQKLRDLKPVLIYLTQPDENTIIRRVADVRLSPDKSLYPDWIDHVISYVSNCPFGKDRNLKGFPLEVVMDDFKPFIASMSQIGLVQCNPYKEITIYEIGRKGE